MSASVVTGNASPRAASAVFPLALLGVPGGGGGDVDGGQGGYVGLVERLALCAGASRPQQRGADLRPGCDPASGTRRVILVSCCVSYLGFPIPLLPRPSRCPCPPVAPSCCLPPSLPPSLRYRVCLSLHAREGIRSAKVRAGGRKTATTERKYFPFSLLRCLPFASPLPWLGSLFRRHSMLELVHGGGQCHLSRGLELMAVITGT